MKETLSEMMKKKASKHHQKPEVKEEPKLEKPTEKEEKKMEQEMEDLEKKEKKQGEIPEGPAEHHFQTAEKEPSKEVDETLRKIGDNAVRDFINSTIKEAKKAEDEEGSEEEESPEVEKIDNETAQKLKHVGQKFKHLAELRTIEILTKLKALGTYAKTFAHEFSEDDVKKIFEQIERELRDVKSEFLSQLADFFSNIEAYDEQYYMHVDLDRLVIYSVNYLEKNKVDPTYEKIVMTAFRLFPSKFALPGFDKFPDGKRVYDSLGHCTGHDRMWLNGNIKSGFHLTEKGKYFFDETEKLLRGEETKKGPLAPTSKGRKETYFITKMKKTPAFKKFANDDEGDISEEEVKEALMGTRTTSRETLQKNWDLLMDYAQVQEERKVLLFLKYLKSRMREVV